jgi:hypothetical protein
MIPDLGGATHIATRPLRVWPTIIDAEEYMTLVVSQNGVRVLFSAVRK